MAIKSTAIWRVRPSGNNLNGGGYDPGIAGAATDYSQQNTAQASSSTGAAAQNSTTFTDTANPFTAAMVGNAIQIASGTNFVAGFYFIVTYNSAGSVVLDRAPATAGAGSVGVYKIGGGWVDFWTNTTAAAGALTPGNTIYILGSGIPNPAAYTYDYTSNQANSASGNLSWGYITYANDPLTPNYKAPPDTTGGMPCIKSNQYGAFLGTAPSGEFLKFQGLWHVATASSTLIYYGQTSGMVIEGCVFDQFGNGVEFCDAGSGAIYDILGCEVFSSVNPGTANTVFAITCGQILTVINSNIHDTIGGGIYSQSGIGLILGNIIAKCGGDGLYANNSEAITGTNYNIGLNVINNTFDDNLYAGIELASVNTLTVTNILNNILSNHANTTLAALNVDAGTTANNNLITPFCDYNVYYNNHADTANISYGIHDTHGGLNPYVGQTTENYTLV